MSNDTSKEHYSVSLSQADHVEQLTQKIVDQIKPAPSEAYAKMKRDSWIANVRRVLQVTEEQATEYWDRITTKGVTA
jgi:hypothetical protein